MFVVDDDVSVRESLELLIRTRGLAAGDIRVRAGIPGSPARPVPSCLVLDVTLPDLNGLDLQKRLAERTDMPIIFITGYGDVPMTVQAMKAGAVEFLTKPFSDDVLLTAIAAPSSAAGPRSVTTRRCVRLRERYASLSRANRRSWRWSSPDC